VSSISVEEIRIALTSSIWGTLMGHLLDSPSPCTVHLSGVTVKLRDPKLQQTSSKEKQSAGRRSPLPAPARDWQPPILPSALFRKLPGLNLHVENSISFEVEALGMKVHSPGLDLAFVRPDDAGAAINPTGLMISLAVHPLSLTLVQDGSEGPRHGSGAETTHADARRNAPNDAYPGAQLLSCHGIQLEIELNCRR